MAEGHESIHEAGWRGAMASAHRDAANPILRTTKPSVTIRKRKVQQLDLLRRKEQWLVAYRRRCAGKRVRTLRVLTLTQYLPMNERGCRGENEGA